MNTAEETMDAAQICMDAKHYKLLGKEEIGACCERLRAIAGMAEAVPILFMGNRMESYCG